MDLRFIILLLMPAMCASLPYPPRDIGACCVSCDGNKEECLATCHPDNVAFSVALCLTDCRNVAQWCKNDCRGRRY